MFSSKAQLEKRTPADGTDREFFLSLLVDEYLNSDSFDAKCQVLANLANFAYDPINYKYIRDVGVLDIFLYVVNKEPNLKLLHFACAGVCNLCVDPSNAEYIIKNCGIKPIVSLLKCTSSDVVADTISTLYYLNNSQTSAEINTLEVKQIMLKLSESEDKRLANLATVFLEDIFGKN